MLIRCDKCNTVYELEDRLVPPQGAQVQCSKCQYVFRAYPSAAEAAPASGSEARRPPVAAPVSDAAPPPARTEPAAASAEQPVQPALAAAASEPDAAAQPLRAEATAGPQFTADGRPIRKVPFPTEQIGSAPRSAIAPAPARGRSLPVRDRPPWIVPAALAAVLVFVLLAWRLFMR